MADKAISELVAASAITATDLFVLEQSGTAKKLTGQVLENWLVSYADGHGGIQNVEKTSTSGLVDTYTITLADETTYTYTVTNAKSISSISNYSNTGTSGQGQYHNWRITYNDGSTQTFQIRDGIKGDTGSAWYTYIKYASVEPTSSSVTLSDLPDEWIGIYAGTATSAPTSYSSYTWYQYKGEKGDTGAAATITASEVVYQASASGTIIPSGTWTASIPTVAQGNYLWTRVTNTYNSGTSVVSYSVAHSGLDGSGSVVSVNNVSPDSNGNVTLTASDVSAMSTEGGTITGDVTISNTATVSFYSGTLDMNGQTLTGLNTPTADTQAANKAYVDNKTSSISGTVLSSSSVARTKLANDALYSPMSSITANTTLALNRLGYTYYSNTTSAITVTVPTNASVAFPNGSEVAIMRYGTGSVTIKPASGVTIYHAGDGAITSMTISEQYGMAALKKISTNVWVLTGSVE